MSSILKNMLIPSALDLAKSTKRVDTDKPYSSLELLDARDKQANALLDSFRPFFSEKLPIVTAVESKRAAETVATTSTCRSLSLQEVNYSLNPVKSTSSSTAFEDHMLQMCKNLARPDFWSKTFTLLNPKGHFIGMIQELDLKLKDNSALLQNKAALHAVIMKELIEELFSNPDEIDNLFIKADPKRKISLLTQPKEREQFKIALNEFFQSTLNEGEKEAAKQSCLQLLLQTNLPSLDVPGVSAIPRSLTYRQEICEAWKFLHDRFNTLLSQNPLPEKFKKFEKALKTIEKLECKRPQFQARLKLLNESFMKIFECINSGYGELYYSQRTANSIYANGNKTFDLRKFPLHHIMVGLLEEMKMEYGTIDGKPDSTRHFEKVLMYLSNLNNCQIEIARSIQLQRNLLKDCEKETQTPYLKQFVEKLNKVIEHLEHVQADAKLNMNILFIALERRKERWKQAENAHKIKGELKAICEFQNTTKKLNTKKEKEKMLLLTQQYDRDVEKVLGAKKEAKKRLKDRKKKELKRLSLQQQTALQIFDAEQDEEKLKFFHTYQEQSSKLGQLKPNGSKYLESWKKLTD